MYPPVFNPYLHKVAVNPYVVGGLGGAGLGLGSGLLWYYLSDRDKRNALTQILLPTLGGAGLGLGAAGLYDYFSSPPVPPQIPQKPSYLYGSSPYDYPGLPPMIPPKQHYLVPDAVDKANEFASSQGVKDFEAIKRYVMSQGFSDEVAHTAAMSAWHNVNNEPIFPTK